MADSLLDHLRRDARPCHKATCVWRKSCSRIGGSFASLRTFANASELGPETLARAMRHRRRRAVHARRSRQGVSDRHEPGSAEEEREPKRVHRLIVPVTRRATGAIGTPFPDSLHMHPDSPPGWVAGNPLRKRPQRRSLFDSMSNHIAKSVNWEPKISKSATSTTVPTDTALPMMRSTTSTMPSPRPSSVIRKPKA